MNNHLKKLENMYTKAAVQKLYVGIEIKVSDGKSEIKWPVSEHHFHAGGSLHGSTCFRLLDDAAYFAAGSVEKDFFLLTSSFHIEFYRPVNGGLIHAIGKLINQNKKIFIAASELYNEKNKLIASGKGIFLKSNILLNSIESYV